MLKTRVRALEKTNSKNDIVEGLVLDRLTPESSALADKQITEYKAKHPNINMQTVPTLTLSLHSNMVQI